MAAIAHTLTTLIGNSVLSTYTGQVSPKWTEILIFRKSLTIFFLNKYASVSCLQDTHQFQNTLIFTVNI